MNRKNIINNYNLEQYNKKYKNVVNKLLKFSMKEVEDFDIKSSSFIVKGRTYNFKRKNYLLKSRKWCYIKADNTYYEIPKTFSLKWLNSLNVFFKLAICLCPIAITGAAIGTVAHLNSNRLRVVDFKTCSWNDISIRCNKLENEEITEQQFIKYFTYDSKPINSMDDFVGKERLVKVNGLNHRVRVIGYNHDLNANNRKLALTFEFANVICDSDGYSLGWQWNDSADKGFETCNYKESSINQILNGRGSRIALIQCASKSSETSWDTRYKNVSILSMLPMDLQSVLKDVKKTVIIASDSSTIKRINFADKLFLISQNELGYEDYRDTGLGHKYAFYKDCVSKEGFKSKRTKTQIKNKEIYSPLHDIIIPVGSGQVCDIEVQNHAGILSSLDDGCAYWTRSRSSSQAICICFATGDLGTGFGAWNARCISPCFCL